VVADRGLYRAFDSQGLALPERPLGNDRGVRESRSNPEPEGDEPVGG
jgi:hypothetical protein